MYNTCNVYSIAISSQTNGDIFLKKKSLKQNLHLYSTEERRTCHDAHSCETIAKSWWKCNLVIWIVHLYLWRREGNCIIAWMLNWFMKKKILLTWNWTTSSPVWFRCTIFVLFVSLTALHHASSLNEGVYFSHCWLFINLRCKNNGLFFIYLQMNLMKHLPKRQNVSI